MFECKICNASYEKACSLGTHLWKTHGLKPKEYYDKYLLKPGDGVCPECGKPTLFRTIGRGYMEFCGKKCAAIHIASDPERNAHKVSAMQSTMQKTYGVSNAAELESVKDKRKETMQERYGVQYYSQSADFGDKYRATSMARYGATSFLGSEAGQKNIMERNMASFGAPYRFCLRTQGAIPAYDAILGKYGCKVTVFNDKKHIAYKCDKCCSVSVEQDLFIKFRDGHGITPCTTCEPKMPHDSFEEREVRDFIQETLGVKCDHYDRNFLGAYGADIVCEDQKVIVEYDGLFWHNSACVTPDYHLTKTKLAEGKGYHLVHIFSDEWQYKQEIVKSRLCNLLRVSIPGKIRRIYARECNVVVAGDADSREFLDANHIQGYTPASQRLSLTYNGEVVAMMTFGPSRFSRREYELIRYCTKLYTSVIGGPGKLLKYFLGHYFLAKPLVSYADRRWSSSNAFYSTIGFTKVSETDPGYMYIVNGNRESRMKYQKYKLVADGADSSKSEEDIMAERGCYRIYDCGNSKYVYGLEAKNG